MAKTKVTGGYIADSAITSDHLHTTLNLSSKTLTIGATTVSGHLIPSANITYDLGSSTNRFRDIYLDGTTINLGGTELKKNSDGDIEFKSGSNFKRLVVSELEFDDGTNRKKFKISSGRLRSFDSSGSDDTADKISLASNTTDDLSEGSSNLYFTTARARGAISASTGIAITDGAISAAAVPNSSLTNSSVTINSNSLSLGGTLTLDTDDIGEGSTNLYYTTARWDTKMAAADTDDLSEGSSNLYFTNTRARGAISVSGNALSYDSSTGVLTASYEESPSFTGNVTISGYVSSAGAYFSDTLRVLNSAGDGWNNWATRSAGNFNLSVGTISSGAITSTGAIQGASFSDGTISGITFIDEDSFATNSATRVPTQQSIKAYVDAQVAGVVDSAPAALNTLNELAAALGDDANFSTTTSDALGNRLRVDTASQGLTGTQQANAITNLGITATKAELNLLDGVTATTTELNYVDGVTSNIQTQLGQKLNLTGGTMTGGLAITTTGNAITINGSAPQILFNDTDHDNFYIHVNSNRFYVLVDRDESGNYETPHPLELNASNNIGYAFGHRLFTEDYHPNADTLTTARTIGGVSFNGSANINLPGVNTAGNQNTSGTAAGLSGTPNITVGTISSGSITVDPSGTYGDGITINAGDNNTASQSAKQIIMSFGGTSSIDYPHSIRTRHNSGSDTGNTVEIYLWDYATDSSSTIGTKRALVLENSTGLDLLTGGYKVGGTTVIDSSGNLTNIGTISSGNITSSGTGTFNTQVLLPKQGTATSTTTAYESATLVLQGSGWDTNGSVARTGSWTIKNVPTASVYPDFDLNFYEEGNELRFQLHGRGTGGHVDPSAATFHGNVNINADSSGSTGAGGGSLAVAGALTLSIDGTDALNFSANSTNDARGISFNNRSALTADYNDGWLRLNQLSEFSNGVYTPSNFRSDGAVRGASYTVVGTTVIDSSRNLTNIGTISSSAITASGNITLYKTGSDSLLDVVGNSSYDPVLNLRSDQGAITTEGFQIWYDNSVGDVHLHTTYPNDVAAIRFHTRTGTSKATNNERFTIEGGGDINVVSGALKFGNTERITSTGALLNLNGDIRSNNVFTFLTQAQAAQTLKAKSLYVGTTYGGNTPSNGMVQASAGFAVGTGAGGTTVIDSSRNLTNIGTISCSDSITLEGGGLILGEDAYSASAQYVGMKSALMTGTNDYMIISAQSTSGDDGHTYVSAKDGQTVHIRGGGNNSSNQIRVPDGSYISMDTSNLRFTGTLQSGTTTVIDSSRNLTNIPTANITTLRVRGDLDTGYSNPGSMTGGISLWSTGATTSQIMFKPTSSGSLGNHGFCTDSYNTYFVMDTTNRGWVFRNHTTATNVASISNTGGASFNNGIKINATTIVDSSRNLTNIGTITSGAIDSSGTSNFDSIRLTDASRLGFGTAKAGATVGHTASVDEGIFWHTSNDYGIYRTAGAWTASNYQQLKIKWATGIEIDGNGTNYGKSGINFLNGNIKMDGTQILDSSRNLTNIGNITATGELTLSNYAQGNMQSGAINLGRIDTNYAWSGTSWSSDVRAGILANCSETFEFVVHDSGDSVDSFMKYNGTDFEMGNDIGWGTTTFTFASNVIAQGTFTSNSSSRSSFGAGSGGNQGIDIKYGSGTADYSAIRFYSNYSNIQTIHTFSSTWSSGNFESGSAGAINIEGLLGVTFGSWNSPDAYIRRTTGKFFTKGQITTNHTGYAPNPDTFAYLSASELQFGGNNNGKESNSAQISAGQHQANSLNFVGMSSGTTSSTRRMDFWVEGNAYFRGDIIATGNVTAYGSASDKRLKKDIVKIDNAIDKIKSVTGYEFAWNENAPKNKQDKREFGVIAQEVEKAGLDKLVFEYTRPVNGTDEETKNLPDEKWKAVHYDKFVPILIEGMKEQQKQIEKLTARIEELENK